VTDRHIITDDRLGFFKGAMQHSSILDIDPMADADCINIAADHRIPPD